MACKLINYKIDITGKKLIKNQKAFSFLLPCDDVTQMMKLNKMRKRNPFIFFFRQASLHSYH